MGKKKEFKDEDIWSGITEEDFSYEGNIEDVDLATYDKEKMTIFFANISYFRQIPNAIDSLKPVERRLLFTMYKLKNFPDRKTIKSSKVSSDTMTLHAHGDDAIYGALVSMTQDWIMPLPYAEGDSNFGDPANSDSYASKRYTDVRMSQFGYDCFFKDYDKDCVEMIFNASDGDDEPLALPCRYPTIVLNGRFGIASGGNFSCIPPFNVTEVMNATKRLIKNPDSNITLYPDFPTGCDIIDDGANLKAVCEAGIGNFRTRARIDVVDTGKCWKLVITNLPWMVNVPPVLEKIVKLVKEKKITIKDVEDVSGQKRYGDSVHSVVKYEIIVDKSHDPYHVRDMLYKHTQLEKTIHMDTKVVLQGFTIGDGMSIRELLLSWIDTRRSYKRRLYNKKITKLTADIDFYSILIELLAPDKLTKTIDIIRTSDSSNVHERLMKLVELSSYQAKRLLSISLSNLTEDSRQRYIKNVAAMHEELERCEKAVRSGKLIDEEILEELDELKDYATPRQSNIIEDTGKIIPNTEHIIVATKMGYVKKFLYDAKHSRGPQVGALKAGDYPTQSILSNNLSQMIFFDSIGRCSSIPVYDIPSTDASQIGTTLYDLTKLNGELIAMYPYFSKQTEETVQKRMETDMNLLTVSADGYFKRTLMEDIRSLSNAKNMKIAKLRDGDKIVYAELIIGISNVLLYTRKGKFVAVSADNIPIMSLNSQGLMSVIPDDGDEYIGATSILPGAKFLFVLTEKGCMKKIDLEFMQTSGKRRPKNLSTLITLDDNDSIAFIGAMNEKVKVVTRSGVNSYTAEDIPTMALRAKGKKLVPIPVGTTITRVEID